MKFSAPRAALSWGVVLLASLAIGATVSVRLGQDANYDLRNYHLYNPWALLNNRTQLDIFPAGKESFYAPLLDMPYYVLSLKWLPNQPRLVAGLMGLPYGMMIFLVFRIAWMALAEFEETGWRRAVVAALATTFGVSGVATVSSVGTTFNEVPNAVIMLLAVALILDQGRGSANDSDRGAWRWVVPGALFGVAAGLKLTASVYAPGAALGIIVTTRGQRQGLRGLVGFTLGWAAAFLAVWGPWAFGVYRLTGNPFFPYFNSVFRSAWLASGSGMDLEALPKSWLQIFFYPFFWTVRNKSVMGINFFRDPRFAIAMGMGLAFGMLAIYSWRRGRNQNLSLHLIGREAKFVLVFVVAGYISWQTVFSQLRYTPVIESLLGIVTTVLACVLARGVWRSGAGLRFLAVSLFSSVVLVVGFLSTSYPDWGRVAYGTSVFEVTSVRLPPDAMILSLGPATSYLAPFIAQHSLNARFVQAAGTPLAAAEYAGGQRIAEAVAGHRGPLYSLAPKTAGRGSHNDPLAQYHLQPTGACTTVRSNIGEDLWLCRLRRTG